MATSRDYFASGETLLDLLGDFWSKVYIGSVPSGKDSPIVAYANGVALAARQDADLVSSVYNAVGLSSADPETVVEWIPITLRESAKYTDSVYIGGVPVTGYVFDLKDLGLADGWKDTTSGSWTLYSAEEVVSAMDGSGVNLVSDSDFVLDGLKGRLVFSSDPFDAANPLEPLAKTRVFSDYSTDREIKVFLKNVRTATNRPRRAVAPITGASFLTKIKNPIISTKLVDLAGKVVLRGFTEAVFAELFDFCFPAIAGRAWTHWRAYQYDDIDLPSLTLPQSVLGSAYTGGLTFNNSVEATDTSTDFRFPIVGDAGDISTFWSTVNAGTIGGKDWPTLVSEYYGSLPATVNPMKFMCQHVLRNRWHIVKVYSSNTVKTEATKYIGNFLKAFWPKDTGILISVTDGVTETTWSGTRPGCGAEIYNVL